MRIAGSAYGRPLALVVLWTLYIIVGLVGVVARPPSTEPLHQVDLYLAIIEILMSLCAVTLVVMMAAICAYAPPDRKTFALTPLAFIVVFSALTCGIHFASLSVGRQIESRVFPLLSQQLSFGQQGWMEAGFPVEKAA
jgi:hypothetical protein